MGRSPCCDKVGLKKGPWTPEEDQKLLAYIQQHGHGSWRALPPKAGLRRCGKSCRLRWTNYLRPDIKRGEFSLHEQQTIIQLHALLGNRWSAIASHLPKRTDNEIKNYWNTHLKKRLTKMGIDPTTHKPKSHAGQQTKDIANLSHMAQWETARLEAEARIVRESKNNIIIINSSSSSISSSSTLHHHRLAAPVPPRPPCLDILKVWQGTWLANNKGKKDFSNIFSGFLESPTSILNFQVEKHHHHNNSSNPELKMIHENPESCTNIIGDERLKGIMGNSAMQQVNHVSANNNNNNNNCFSDFLEGYGDGSDDNVIFMEEDNDHKINTISYWNNILNSMGSPIDVLIN